MEWPFNYAGDIRKQQHSSHSGKQLSEYNILDAARGGGGKGKEDGGGVRKSEERNDLRGV